jgi:hypothetical protein
VYVDLDTLATALYCRIDDELKASPQLSRWRPAVGIAPKITDAELITVSVMQALLGFHNESRWIRYARKSIIHLFPYLPKQPGYNKRLRSLSTQLAHFIATATAPHTPGSSGACVCTWSPRCTACPSRSP